MPVEEKIKCKTEHFKSLRKTLTAAVESCEIITNTAVRTLYQVCLRFSYGVWLGNVQHCENGFIAAVRISIDMIDIRSETFNLTINVDCLLVAPTYFKRNNTFLVPRVSSPNGQPLSFFSIKVYISSISIISAVSEKSGVNS